MHLVAAFRLRQAVVTPDEAQVRLGEFIESCQDAIRAAVWAQAMLSYPGEATWDAVKGVAASAARLSEPAQRIGELPGRYTEILP